jgi:hypothetical protein
VMLVDRPLVARPAGTAKWRAGPPSISPGQVHKRSSFWLVS